MPGPSERTRALLDQLVTIDSTSARSNAPVIGLCTDVLEEAGAVVERIQAPAAADKAGLLARFGPDVEGGVVLSGHTDCVPVGGQPWTVDPFAVTERDGTLVGRGVTDMKGFIACVLAAGPQFAAADLEVPVWVLLTWDEEIGTVGAEPMTDALLARTTPRCAIVGEPTSMRPVVAHKGVRSLRVEVTGRDGHSSQPAAGANALIAAARVAARIDDVASAHRSAAADPLFEPPCTTFNVATMAGGQAINIIPRDATLTFEYRPVPHDDSWALADELRDWAHAELLPAMQAVDEDCDITFTRTAFSHGLTPEVGPHAGDVEVREPGAAEALVRRLTGFDGEGGTVPFGTDGGAHQAGGLSTVVCGPGDIAQAHQPDEWIDPAQLGSCDVFLTRLVGELA